MADGMCPQCGHVNPPGSNFCSSCGSTLDTGRHDETAGHDFDPSEETRRLNWAELRLVTASAEEAGAFLSPGQLETLAKMQENKRSMAESGIRMQRAMLGEAAGDTGE